MFFPHPEGPDRIKIFSRISGGICVIHILHILEMTLFYVMNFYSTVVRLEVRVEKNTCNTHLLIFF